MVGGNVTGGIVTLQSGIGGGDGGSDYGGSNGDGDGGEDSIDETEATIVLTEKMMIMVATIWERIFSP
jgi:hypothetical protein